MGDLPQTLSGTLTSVNVSVVCGVSACCQLCHGGRGPVSHSVLSICSNSVKKLLHFPLRISTASSTKTFGGKAPVDSTETGIKCFGEGMGEMKR